MAFMPALEFAIGGNNAVPDTRNLVVTIGRDNELNQCGPGSLIGIINNRHRKWEPGFATGYLPQPGMETRLNAIVDSTTYNLFTGRAVGFPQQWAAGGADGFVSFTALDELSKLAKLKLRSSTFEAMRYGFRREPVAWYSFDGDGATAGASDDAVVNDSIGSRNGVARGVVDWNQPSLLGSKLGSSVGLPAGGWLILPPSVGAYLAGSGFTLSFLYRRAENIDRAGETIVHVGNGAGSCFRILHNAAGRIQAQTPDGTTLSTLYRVGTGRTHHIAVVRDGGSVELFLDGVSQATGTWGGTVSANSPILIGTNPGQGIFTEATYADCFIDEFAIRPGDIGDSQVAALDLGLRQGWAGQRSGERIAFIIDQLLTNGLTASFLGGTTLVETGNSVLGADGWDEGTNALEVIQKIATTEQGRFFIDGNGDFNFHSRWHDFNEVDAPTPKPTFRDHFESVDEIIYIAEGFAYDYDDRYIINRAQVSTPHLKGPAERADTTSIETYTETTRQIQTLSRDFNEADAYAQSLLRKYKDPAMRLREFTWCPQRDNSWDVALTLKPGSVIYVIRAPRENGVFDPDNPIPGQLFVVERVKHDIDCMKGVWMTSVFAVTFEVPTHWILGTSELGTDTALVF